MWLSIYVVQSPRIFMRHLVVTVLYLVNNVNLGICNVVICPCVYGKPLLLTQYNELGIVLFICYLFLVQHI